VKANRLILLAVTGTCVLALTGCAPSGNVAARVGDTSVPTSDVDFLARMQCATLDKAAEDPTQAQQGVQEVATSQVRVSMVNLLVQSELNRQLAARDHHSNDKTTQRNAMVQFESVVKLAPAKDQTRFRDLIEDVYRGQLEVYELAQQQLASQGVSNPSQDDVDQAIAKVQDDFRKSVDVDVNPQYGADDAGVAGSVDPSLSVAVSSFAKQSQSKQSDSSWITKLPSDQRCG
jgi:hypothetical protein